MRPLRRITIVGGGLAGLTLGLALRWRRIPVAVVEAGSYPRHKVCGEFISGDGLITLEQLDCLDRLLQNGARWARRAVFFLPGWKPVQLVLPKPALCVSRFVLDAFLAQEFRGAGGVLQEQVRRSRGSREEGVVWADGRRARPVVRGWRWYGLKVHVRRFPMQADVEMHVWRDGYVGLCQLSDCVNVCGLFRSRTPRPEIKGCWREILGGEPGSDLSRRLAEAELDETTFCSVAGLCVEPRRWSIGGECRIGDALTMTPPITGNGMSMALEAAELAAGPLARFSDGELAWTETREEIARRCARRFRSRLGYAAALHRVLSMSKGARIPLAVLSRFPGLVRVLYGLTR